MMETSFCTNSNNLSGHPIPTDKEEDHITLKSKKMETPFFTLVMEKHFGQPTPGIKEEPHSN